MKQGAKVSWSKGFETVESVLLSLWSYINNQYQTLENHKWIYREGYSRPEEHCETIQHN